MDAPLLSQHELIRPWRRATLVASLVAAVELVLLVGAAALLLAEPFADAVQSRASATALTPSPEATKAKSVLPQTISVGLPDLARQETGVFVLNGNGRSGAAAAAASKLRRLGYVVPGTGNAPRQDYATTVVMYRTGYKAEALRLAKDLKLKAVAPLDGISPGALAGGHLAVILGAG